MTLPLAEIQAPEIDYKALSPLMATVGGSIVVLMVGLLRGALRADRLVPALTAIALLTAIGLTIWIWEPGVQQPILEGSLTMDTLALGLSMLFYVAGLVCVALSLRADAAREAGHGEYHSMLLGSITGMVVLARGVGPDHAVRRASSCSRSRSTCCARPSCAGAPRSRPGSSTW